MVFFAMSFNVMNIQEQPFGNFREAFSNTVNDLYFAG